MSHVVVVGGGFAGTRAVERLSRADAAGRVEVTLVDRSNHYAFAPLLYQVATAGLSPQDVARSLRAMNARRDNVQVRHGEVEAIDLVARELRLDSGASLTYDHLVLAPGSVTADFGVPGVREHAFTLKSVADAVTIRNHVLERFDAAAAGTGRDGELTIVVAGGGATGVELAGAMAELRDVLLQRDFAELADRRVRVVLIEQRDSVLSGFAEPSRRYAQRVLQRAGVELLLGVGIRQVSPDGVELGDGTLLAARTVIWTAGVRANSLVAALGVATDRSGRIPVEPDLSLAGHPEVSVVGDAALIVDGEDGPVPQAPPRRCSRGATPDQILRRLDGRATAAFRYRDKGSMATIGRNAAVNEYPIGVRLRGFPAWVAWLFLHLLYLSGFRNRLSALLTWSWSYLTFDRSLRVLYDAPGRAASGPQMSEHAPVSVPHLPHVSAAADDLSGEGSTIPRCA